MGQRGGEAGMSWGPQFSRWMARESGAREGRKKVELARGWSLVTEVPILCWELRDFTQWILVSRASLLFKWRFISLIFYLGHSG